MRRARSTTARTSPAVALLASAALFATATACGSSSHPSSAAASVQLSLVAYSTPQEAYAKIEKAFQATPQGRRVTFTESFGASGDQSRAVEAGLKADVVAFSLEPDMTRLVKAGIVAPEASRNVTDSVVVLVVRKGNPKHIKDWNDLTKPGIEVITANPFTSGGARWNVMAAYGAAANKGADDAAGQAFLGRLFEHVPVQDDSARKSLQTFAGGKGDVLLAYENEAVFAQQHGQAIDYVVPDQTIRIETPVAATATSAHPQQAKAFVDFLFSPAAQRIFADAGYRAVTAGVHGRVAFTTPPGLFTIADLGGWPAVNKRFFDPATGLLVGIERKLGVATSK